MSPEVALNRISPMLSPFISSVVRNGKVGLDATNCLRITDLKSGYVPEWVQWMYQNQFNLYLMTALPYQTHKNWPRQKPTKSSSHHILIQLVLFSSWHFMFQVILFVFWVIVLWLECSCLFSVFSLWRACRQSFRSVFFIHWLVFLLCLLQSSNKHILNLISFDKLS